jgi:hypothetical protein
MDKVRVDLAELKQAIAEIEGRTNDLRVTIEVQDRQVKLSASDRGDNLVEAVLYDDGKLGAQFRCTERLMFMKKK